MIYFIRHGSTDWNENLNKDGIKDPRCQGVVDLDINEKGIKQAKETGEKLKGIKFDRVICSPLKRVKQTIDIIYKGKVSIIIDERLIERDFGEFEGLTRKEFDFDGFWNANSKEKYIKAESLENLKERVFSLLNELKENPDENILIVSHGGLGCVFASYFLGVPDDGNYLQYEIPHGKPLILDLRNIKE